jgi:hypothetical protein
LHFATTKTDENFMVFSSRKIRTDSDSAHRDASIKPWLLLNYSAFWLVQVQVQFQFPQSRMDIRSFSERNQTDHQTILHASFEIYLHKGEGEMREWPSFLIKSVSGVSTKILLFS